MPSNQPFILMLDYIVSRKVTSPFQDRRRRLNVVLCSYRGPDGHEYRKSFAAYGEPIVPKSGTNADLNDLAKQW